MENSIAIKKGFTLLELTAVMVIVGVLLTVIISNCTNFINRAKFQATVRGMGSIAQAAIDYYNSSNNPNDPSNPVPLAWPSNPLMLANNADSNNNNMPQSVTINPFGYSYQLSTGNNMITVTTFIPKGILVDPSEGSFLNITHQATVDQVSITQSIPNEFSGRLTYDLQYLDKQ
jgi:prepilin-type N-terminal cleavage/methylation domain-containing protein